MRFINHSIARLHIFSSLVSRSNSKKSSLTFVTCSPCLTRQATDRISIPSVSLIPVCCFFASKQTIATPMAATTKMPVSCECNITDHISTTGAVVTMANEPGVVAPRTEKTVSTVGRTTPVQTSLQLMEEETKEVVCPP